MRLGGEALKVMGDRTYAPLLALAALVAAAAEVAVITDTSYTNLMELVSLHYRDAQVLVQTQELEAQVGLQRPKTESEPS